MVLLDKSRATMPKAPILLSLVNYKIWLQDDTKMEYTAWVNHLNLLVDVDMMARLWPHRCWDDAVNCQCFSVSSCIHLIRLFFEYWNLAVNDIPHHIVLFFLMDQSSSMLLMPCQLSGLVRFKTHPAKATGGISKQTRPNFRFCFCVDTLW